LGEDPGPISMPRSGLLTVSSTETALIDLAHFPASGEDVAVIASVQVDREDELGAAVRSLGIGRATPALVLIGGADDMDDADADELRSVFEDVLVPVAEAARAVVLDGGTDTGVMRLIGRARTNRKATFALVGVAVAELVSLDGEPAAAGLEPHHTHFVLVPGSAWGDESRWIARLGSAITGDSPSVTVLLNGGEIAFEDVAQSIEAGRPVVVLEGSGRAADVLAAALHGGEADPRSAELVRSGLVRSAHIDDRSALKHLVERLLSAS
jgi:hypothetical protein